MIPKRSRWPKCPRQKWPTRSSDEDFPCLIAFFITRWCLWKLTFVVEGTANEISALSWHPPSWDFTIEKLMQNLRPEQKSLKYTNMCQQRKIFSNMKYFALSKNRANIQMHRQQLQLPCQSRKCSYSWFCMGDWVGIFLQVELIYREYATRSLHWFVNSYISNIIY